MTHRDDLDQMLSAWLDDPYSPPAPGYLGEVLERTRRTRQRPAWASLERWLPMVDKIARPALAPPLRVALILLISLLLVALVATIVVVGAQLLNPKRQVYEIPHGGAAVLAYASTVGDSGDIFTVRADGTDARQLTSGPGAKGSPTFSPDGTRIAYREWRAGSRPGSGIETGGNDVIVVMDAGGGHRTILATNTSSAAYCSGGDLSWSPDGSSLIFRVSLDCDHRFDLFIVPTDGSAAAVKLLAPGIDSARAVWSPDGSRIALVGGDPAGGLGVYVIDVGPAGILSGGLTPRLIAPMTGSLSDAGPATWSPDGTKLVFVSTAGLLVAGDVAVIGADGSGSRVLAKQAYNPRWSPDGRRVAFHRTVDPSEYFMDRPCTARIWVVDSDGANERRLDDLVDPCDAPPSWSPDGTRITGSLIASTVAEPALGPHLGIITIDGSSPTVILEDAPGVTWQPLAAPLPPAPSFAPGSPSP